ncbi:hypothetical protein TPHA_0A00570 [Tetrapisispora phaffii CBS 4417]|uniref:tRNA pseudouridine(55) synthase n=1 Tax=Tetrapisispora phaffii (strain ATCC 24235 / CBS 4417 / NBRC 1672 / NRRL Y-8282 / UCD 70-5) TaxID=1071381 RepID=G8BML4_TETPH|nr:hypothetical protein TPHA_0A00570 [Tetrapisispora phaffii CBS 4417]CCE61142.1 hypothetical protein TPHA_0A00570 [Tetrapisispora phaffii CBS 4417]
MNGIFAIEKPTGITSNQFMMKLQHLLTNSQVFSKEIQRATTERIQQYQKETGKKASKRKLRKVSKVKMGHGGTLDPLASGVLVIGIGTGTKQLANYLSGTVKVYETEALFGVSTTSGDVEGDILSQNSVKHINIENLKTIPEKFIGSLKQTPPIYAALKMNGKPLHEYAREGKPLPRAIEPRQVNIYDLVIYPDSCSKNHNYDFLRKPTDELTEVTIKDLNANMLKDSLYFSKEFCEKYNKESELADVEPAIELSEEERAMIENDANYRAPLLHFKAKVSSGTYIRSLISDIGKAMRSSSYMVKLIRLQQQDWSLEKGNVFKMSDFTENDELVWSRVLELVLKEGASVNIADATAKIKIEVAKELEEQAQLARKNALETDTIAQTTTVTDDKLNLEQLTSNKRSIDEV